MLTNPKINDRVVVAPGFVPEARCIPDSVGAAIAGKVGVVMELLDEGGDLGACVIFPGQSHTWAFDYSDLKPAPTETPTPCPECADLRARLEEAERERDRLRSAAADREHHLHADVRLTRGRYDAGIGSAWEVDAAVRRWTEAGCPVEREVSQADIDAALVRATEAERDRERYRLALENLTPGGSEYYRDPERCVEAIRYRFEVGERMAKAAARTQKVAAEERDSALARTARLEAILAAERGERGLEGMEAAAKKWGDEAAPAREEAAPEAGAGLGSCDRCGRQLPPGSADPATGIILCPGGCATPAPEEVPHAE